MGLNERQNEILKILRKDKRANVHALAQALYVSEATIRRDLNDMKALGLVERSHGGAILPENSEEAKNKHSDEVVKVEEEKKEYSNFEKWMMYLWP